MRCLIQRVTRASVKVGERITGGIGTGLLVLVGFEAADDEIDQAWIIKKLLNMRIFPDEGDVMNLSLQDVNGELLVVSQFTLHASTKKGNRPSYIKADKPESAQKKYHDFVVALAKESGKMIETGEFGAMMDVSMVNWGPITLMLDSRNKE